VPFNRKGFFLFKRSQVSRVRSHTYTIYTHFCVAIMTSLTLRISYVALYKNRSFYYTYVKMFYWDECALNITIKNYICCSVHKKAFRFLFHSGSKLICHEVRHGFLHFHRKAKHTILREYVCC